MKLRLIDMRNIILFLFLEVTSLINPKEEDKVTFMPELY